MSAAPYRPKYGQPIEHAIVRAVIESCHRAGFVPVKVWDGEEYVAARTEREVLDAVFAVGMATIHFTREQVPESWGNLGVLIVVGNGEDALSDWHCGDSKFNAALERAEAAIENHFVTIPLAPLERESRVSIADEVRP